MIRAAALTDVGPLVQLGARMHEESPRFSRLRFDAGRLSATLKLLIESDGGFVMVYESGGILLGGMVATIVPHWCSTDLVATDLALYVVPEARGGMAPARLVQRYLHWAKERGATLVQIGVTTGVHTEETARLLEALGLRRCGVILEA